MAPRVNVLFALCFSPLCSAASIRTERKHSLHGLVRIEKSAAEKEPLQDTTYDHQAGTPSLWPAYVKGSSSSISVLQTGASQSVSVYVRHGFPLPRGRTRHTREQQDYTVCLSTTPARVGSIQHTVDSLLNQKPFAPSKVILTVPNTIRGQSVKEGDLQWMKNKSEYNKRLVIQRIGGASDFGPATKLMGCLEVIPESEDSCVVITDDDMVRPEHWAQLLLHQHSCTAENRRVAGGFSDGPSNDPMFKSMVHGYRGWAVHRSFLAFEKLHAFWASYRDSCFFVDDEMFTGYLRSQCLAIDILYSNDADHRIPAAAELISDDSMHHDSHGLSSSPDTGGQKKASACMDMIEGQQKTTCALSADPSDAESSGDSNAADSSQALSADPSDADSSEDSNAADSSLALSADPNDADSSDDSTAAESRHQ